MQNHPSPLSWFCLKTQPKHEHIAAAHLRRECAIEVYLPRIRFRRSTREGPVWFTEALFPGYLFARFELAVCHRRVHHVHGVQGIVHFGLHWPTIPEGAIQELQGTVGAQEVHVIPDAFEPGDSVIISGGSLHALRAVVTRVMPSRNRVAVLLDFLGRQTVVELPQASVVRETGGARSLLGV
jgi:transcriptional antiterminator RfaH